ncbi:adoMet-dependent rRNA methyltransferase spb1 [Benincasa hispida]|uniref:adoMet-dependent rRNA methyltransferase spb1 n=1 Tax=Benincasa hispida TaxID=102211 RepID=UPI0018FF85BB|nr:adoMet-dependent rRNA methyltransferase spb1 [Benincasa hispida]
MGKVKGKHRLDKYYRLAKEHGYRSRASWKLAQLDSKYNFLRSSHAVLDLCAAPGGWMQIAVERVPVGSLVVGVDLVPIAPVRGAVAIEQDITKPECKARLKKIMSDKGCAAFDLILHDGSPNVGGAWAQEAMAQNSLVIDSVKLATQLLAPKGTFVTKVFRSQDYSSVLYCLKQLFNKVEVDKPAASRSTSAEIYILGFSYKAPAKIDPHLLDVKHLFQGSVEPQRKVVDVLRGTKQKRHRDGYEDGDMTLRKVSSASNFIWSDSPLEILGTVTCITFDDPACLPIKDNDLTTEEVKALCDDLRVLGKQDFKHLLKWRLNIRKALSPNLKATSTLVKDAENEVKQDEDDKLLNEMEELTYAMERKKKRAKKLLAKRKAKDKARKAMGAQLDVMEEGYVDHELFSLSNIKGKNDLRVVDSTDYDDGNDEFGEHENDVTNEENHGSSASDIDSDEERRRYDEHMEELLDQAYESFISRKEGTAKQRKRARKAYSDDVEMLEEDENGVDGVQSDYDSDENIVDADRNPLMVSLDDGAEPTQEDIANKWFSQDIFAEAAEEGDLKGLDSEDDTQVDGPKESTAVSKEGKSNIPKNAREKSKISTESNEADNGFEVVPAPATDSSDSSSSEESDDEDPDTKAEILACAKKMLRKKQREQILDDSYNKYMFDDTGLPKWFLDEERRHRQPIKPVTKEEVAAMRAQFKEIDARPAKKVAEAKARKKRVAMKRLEKVRKKANVISDQADISDRSKRKMIDQLYKKAVPQRPKKELVVAKKGVQVRVGKGKVLVDRRMKKDARKHGMSKQGKGSKKGKNSKAPRAKGGFAKDSKAPRGNAGFAKASGKKGRKGNK